MKRIAHHWQRTAWRRHVCTTCGLQLRTVGRLWWPRHIHTDATWHGILVQITGAPTLDAAYNWPAQLTGEEILERLLALNLNRANPTP